MFRLTVLVLAGLAILRVTECQADVPDPQLNHKDGLLDSNGDDSVDRAGISQAYASVQSYPRGSGAGGGGKPTNYNMCYSCVDCPKVLANTTYKYCPHVYDPNRKNNCVSYAEKYPQMKKVWYVRGCATELGSCADIKNSHSNNPAVKLVSCKECDGNKCNTNGVPHFTYDITTALIALVLCPVLGKYVLS